MFFPLPNPYSPLPPSHLQTIKPAKTLDTKLRHTAFFEHLNDFGYFNDLTESLPANFSSVFEIARVLEDESSTLFKRLEPALTVASIKPKSEEKTRGWQPNRHVPVINEFDVDFIRSVSEVGRILPAQHLLPEPVFLRKLSRRELLRRVARNPVIFPFGSSSTEYTPNFFKQKVYILLDTSASMISHHRFQMAKAVAFVFLKRNLRELGHIYFRTFDREISPMLTATDEESLRALIKSVMRLSRLGNGTVLEKAILTACDDIRDEAELSGAELLVITDGAAHLDKVKICEALGSSITINAIKIGDASVAFDEKILHDEASRGSSPESHSLARVEEQLRHLEYELANASTSRTNRIQAEMEGLRNQANKMLRHIIESLRAEYGREIESISRVFVNIDDISTDALFHLSPEQIEELRELVIAAEEEFREGVNGETLKEVALLYEHLSMLIEEADIAEENALREMQARLSALLDNAAESFNRSTGMGGVSRDDARDIGFMLQHRSFGDHSILKIFLDLVRRFIKAPKIMSLKIRRK